VSKLSILNPQLSSLLLVLAGCGVSQAEYNARLTDVEKCQAELAHNQVELGAAHARMDDKRRDLEARDEQIGRLEADARALGRNLSATERELIALRKSRALAEQRAEIFRTLATRLREPVAAGTLAVDIRKGRMFVRVGEALLFEPGHAALKPEGQKALKQVAQALKEIPDRDFLVAGHTDNRSVKGSFASNWDLSAARAVAVVRFLQAEGLDPRHLAAAGYSEFDAVASNESNDSRAHNRRIEVVVMPRVDELPAIDLTEPPRGAAGLTEPPPSAAPAAPTNNSHPPPAAPTQ
jgi:chemotaxis protein MotB